MVGCAARHYQYIPKDHSKTVLNLITLHQEIGCNFSCYFKMEDDVLGLIDNLGAICSCIVKAQHDRIMMV